MYIVVIKDSLNHETSKKFDTLDEAKKYANEVVGTITSIIYIGG